MAIFIFHKNTLAGFPDSVRAGGSLYDLNESCHFFREGPMEEIEKTILEVCVPELNERDMSLIRDLQIYKRSFEGKNNIDRAISVLHAVKMGIGRMVLLAATDRLTGEEKLLRMDKEADSICDCLDLAIETLTK